MTTKAEIQKEVLELLHERKKQLSRTRFSNFVRFTFEKYDMQWFHKAICDYLDKLLNGDIKKLMIFVPPQHGKSELSSRRFPAYALGKNPNTKIAVCSYSGDLASSFNDDIQKIIKGELYSELYPNTEIGTNKDYKANSKVFQVANKRGFLKSVGVGGSLTGTPVDLGIIDDPFKDRAEANSITIRNKTWLWYQDVFLSRLHNDSKQLMLFTRWHEDDIAGRLLDPNNPFYDEQEASEWTVLAIPAIKEAVKPLSCAIDLVEDTRQLGEALWENKHSRKKYEKMKRINPTGYASLAQQRPAPLEGDMIKEEWFKIKKPKELDFDINSVTWNLWIDGAWTKKETDKRKKANDPDDTAVLYEYFDKANKILYIRIVQGVQKEILEVVDYLDSHAQANGATSRSKVHIELKASGFAIHPLLRQKGYNTVKIDNKHVRLGKYNRVEQCEPFLASERIVLIQGGWNREFLAQCTAFPNGAHDDLVDVLCYPILHYFVKGKKAAKTNYRN
jgi:predicted phage terminase large subunit-like protein